MYSSPVYTDKLTCPAYHELPDMAANPALTGFLPAFLDLDTHEVHLSVDEHGRLADRHLLDNLPSHWVSERDNIGRITALKDRIIAGFMRQERFYTRAQLARLPWDA